MKKTQISTFEFLEMFPDEEAARKYIENRRWPNGVVCPFCNHSENVVARKRKNGQYVCNGCFQEFTVRTGTIFERSHIPLNKWLFAMYLLVTARKGISSLQIAKEIGVGQKAAWFMLHRLREACGNDPDVLSGIIEIDETYVGGKEKNKHKSKKLLFGRGTKGKIPVLGMREKTGNIVAYPLKDTSVPTIQEAVKKSIKAGSEIHTDEATAYEGMPEYTHKFVTHSAKEYVRDGVTTNGIESTWAVLKRGLNGVYHSASEKHLGRYVNEFAFRLNDGNCAIPRLERLARFIKASVGCRITYKRLIS